MAKTLKTEFNHENDALRNRVAELEVRLVIGNTLVLSMKADLVVEEAKRVAAEDNLAKCMNENSEVTEKYAKLKDNLSSLMADA